MQRTKPPFRADMVGSLLRTAAVAGVVCLATPGSAHEGADEDKHGIAVVIGAPVWVLPRSAGPAGTIFATTARAVPWSRTRVARSTAQVSRARPLERRREAFNTASTNSSRAKRWVIRPSSSS